MGLITKRAEKENTLHSTLGQSHRRTYCIKDELNRDLYPQFSRSTSKIPSLPPILKRLFQRISPLGLKQPSQFVVLREPLEELISISKGPGSGIYPKQSPMRKWSAWARIHTHNVCTHAYACSPRLCFSSSRLRSTMHPRSRFKCSSSFVPVKCE